MTKGTKYDDKKAPLDLLPPASLEAIAEVLAFGEKKYGAGNWSKGLEYRRLISAALRHIGAFNGGEDKDPETGLSHVAHAACCLLFLSHMEQKRPDMDNRWAKTPLPEPKPKTRDFEYLVLGRFYLTQGGDKVQIIQSTPHGNFFLGDNGVHYGSNGTGPVDVEDAVLIKEVM